MDIASLWLDDPNTSHNFEKIKKLQRGEIDLEDEIGKSPVTPGHVLPARELLGDMLTQLNRADEAQAAYEATLSLSPNRARSLNALQEDVLKLRRAFRMCECRPPGFGRPTSIASGFSIIARGQSCGTALTTRGSADDVHFASAPAEVVAYIKGSFGPP